MSSGTASGVDKRQLILLGLVVVCLVYVAYTSGFFNGTSGDAADFTPGKGSRLREKIQTVPHCSPFQELPLGWKPLDNQALARKINATAKIAVLHIPKCAGTSAKHFYSSCLRSVGLTPMTHDNWLNNVRSADLFKQNSIAQHCMDNGLDPCVSDLIVSHVYNAKILTDAFNRLGSSVLRILVVRDYDDWFRSALDQSLRWLCPGRNCSDLSLSHLQKTMAGYGEFQYKPYHMMHAATEIEGVVILNAQDVNHMYDLLRKRFCPGATLTQRNDGDSKIAEFGQVRINIPGQLPITLNKTTYSYLMPTMKLLDGVGHALPARKCLEENLKSGLSYQVTQV